MGGAGGGAIGDSAAACEGVCVLGTCAGDVCVQPDQLLVTVSVSETKNPDGTPSIATKAQSCGYGLSLKYESLATEGSCWILTSTLVGGSFNPIPFDAGMVKVSDPTSGSLSLQPACQTKTWGVGAACSPGEMVTVDATGGADSPPFSLQAAAPAALSVSVSPFKSGDPFTISWSPPPPPRLIQMALQGGKILECAPSEQGSVTLSGAFTAAFGQISVATVLVALRGSLVQQDLGGGKLAALFVGSQALVSVPLAP